MEKTIDFQVKENSLQEFADKYIVLQERPEDIGRGERKIINPYYILGKQEIFVRKEIMEVIINDPMITFTLSDESRHTRTLLTNTYQYSIEEYDNLLLKLILVDFKVEVSK